jgi:hypothetical protein
LLARQLVTRQRGWVVLGGGNIGDTAVSRQTELKKRNTVDVKPTKYGEVLYLYVSIDISLFNLAGLIFASVYSPILALCTC